jgi:hypothetical protein
MPKRTKAQPITRVEKIGSAIQSKPVRVGIAELFNVVDACLPDDGGWASGMRFKKEEAEQIEEFLQENKIIFLNNKYQIVPRNPETKQAIYIDGSLMQIDYNLEEVFRCLE